MLGIYAVKDVKEKLVGRGIFCAVNDGVARRMLSITISREMNPIGLDDKILVQIGEFDESTGLIKGMKDNLIRDVCCLKDIFNEVKGVLDSYAPKK